MISKLSPSTSLVVHRSVNACLFPLAAADSCNVTTVEGIGSVAGGLHPVQRRMTDAHGSQCGYCTPGIVMAAYSMLRSNPDLSVAEVEEHMDGNICRCTGYRPIWDAVKSLCSDARSGPCGSSCSTCPSLASCDVENAAGGSVTAENNVRTCREGCEEGARPEGGSVCTSSESKFRHDEKFMKSYKELGIEEVSFWGDVCVGV